MVRFVGLMGGYIWIESEGLEKGCTASFIIRLGICNGPSSSSGSMALRLAAKSQTRAWNW